MKHVGNKIRNQKKSKTTFFKMPEPHTRDKQLINRHEVMSSETDLRYNQSSKIKKPSALKGKKAKDQEILDKETKK